MSDLKPCDPEVYAKGELIAVLHKGTDSKVVEAWVRRVAALAKARLDWYIEGGYPQVLHLGNDQTYASAIRHVKEFNGINDIRVYRTLPRGRISGFRRDR